MAIGSPFSPDGSQPIELRRYLRHTTTLLAEVEPLGDDRLSERWQLLRRARHWIAAAAVGVERLLAETEERLAIAETINDPLTARTEMTTIAPACTEQSEVES